MLLVLLVVASAAAPSARAQAPLQDDFRVDAIGDSIPAGFGITVDHGQTGKIGPIAAGRCASKMPTSTCDQPSQGWPSRLGAMLTADDTGGLPVMVHNWALSGAATFRYQKLPGDKGAERGSLASKVQDVIDDDPDVILVQLGADDVLSGAGVLHLPTCALSPICTRHRLADVKTEQRLHTLLQAFSDKTGADIYVMRYYRSSSDLANMAGQLNAIIDQAAAGVESVTVVKPPSFLLHLCGSPFSWMLGAFHDVCFHPNPTGQLKLGEAVLKAIRANG
jgi:lysophospholipase L1-like esterase